MIWLELALLIIVVTLLIIRWRHIPLLGRFPGNIVIKVRNFKINFPLGLSITVSLILTYLLNLIFAR